MLRKEIKVNCILDYNYEYARILVMQTKDGAISLPIIISLHEADALLKEPENFRDKRPQTYDLFFEIANSVNLRLIEVYIHDFCEGIFYTSMIWQNKDKEFVVDSRPSDAIVLAIKYGAPIFVEESVLSKTAILSQNVDSMFFDTPDDPFALNNPPTTFDNLPIDYIKEALAVAIEREDFEEAARLRDAINRRIELDCNVTEF